MRILIISSLDTFTDPVQAACVRYDDVKTTIRTADTVGQGLELAEQIEAELVIIDLTHNVEAGIVAIEELSTTRRSIAVSAESFNAELMARAIRAGATEVITQPIDEDDVQRLLRKTQKHITALSETQQSDRTGKIIVCFSSKGGVGKSTTSCNLAVTLAKRFPPDSVCIVDANQQVPNVASMLDLRPQSWLMDAIREYKRLDSSMLDQFATDHESGLQVLAHKTGETLDDDFSEDELSKVLLVCKGKYKYTIVDTFPLLTSLNLAIMDLADKILLITEAVVPSLRTAKYNLHLLQQAGYGENRIEVVVNRYTNFKGNVSEDIVERTLDWPIEHFLPYDVHTTIATNAGKTIVEKFPNRPLSLAYEQLAAKAIDEDLPILESSMLDKVRGWIGI